MTVYAVVKVTIEIPVRSSSPKESMEELHDVSLREAEEILKSKLTDDFRIVGKPSFSHAIVKSDDTQ